MGFRSLLERSAIRAMKNNVDMVGVLKRKGEDGNVEKKYIKIYGNSAYLSICIKQGRNKTDRK